MMQKMMRRLQRVILGALMSLAVTVLERRFRAALKRRGRPARIVP